MKVDIKTAYELFELRNKVDGLSHHTQRNYSSMLRFFREWLGDRDEINTNVLRAYFYELQQKDLALPTVATHYRCLSTFFNFLVAENHLDKNPWRA